MTPRLEKGKAQLEAQIELKLFYVVQSFGIKVRNALK